MLKIVKKLIQNEFLLLTLLVIYSLHILLQTGFNGDDAYNTQIAGRMIDDSYSLSEMLLTQTRDWFLHSKRILFSYFFIYPIFYYFHDFESIKLITISFVLLSILLFYKFFSMTSGNKHLLFLAAFIALISIQFRNWHDPILIFPSHLLPYLVVLSFLSLITFYRFLQTEKTIFLVLSLLLYAWSIFTYEVNIVLIPIYFFLCLSFKNNFKYAIKKTMGHFLILCLYFSLFIFAILIFPQDAKNAYATFASFDILLFFKAFLIQLSAAIPGSYYYVNRMHIDLEFYYYDYIIFCISLVALQFNFIKINNYFIDRSKTIFLVIAGLIFLVFPAIISAISSHQKEIITVGIGYGYITVYYQYFGLAILLALLIINLSNSIKNIPLKKSLFFSISLLLSIILVLNSSANRTVALQTNATHKYPQELQLSALSQGLMSDVEGNDYLIRSMRHANDWKWSYFKQLKKKIKICDYMNQFYANGAIKLAMVSECLNEDSFIISNVNNNIVKYSPKRDVWLASYNIDKIEGVNGQAFFGKLNHIFVNKKNGNPIYVDGTILKSYDQNSNLIKIHNKKVDFSKVFEFESIPIKTIDINDAIFSEKTILTFFEGLTNQPETSISGTLRWISGSFSLNIHNPLKDSVGAKLSVKFLNPGNQSFVISLTEDSVITDKISIRESSRVFEKVISLKPGINSIRFDSTGVPINNGDPRNMIYGVFNLNIEIDKN